MGLSERLLGFVSAPFVGARQEITRLRQNVGGSVDTAEDIVSFQQDFGPALSQQLAPTDRIVEPYGSLADRSSGTYRLIPGRALSAQTRLKNMSWELPAANWTQNPDGAPYILRTPGLPGMQINMMNVNAFSTQPEFLQPVSNLQIQNDMGWIAQFRKAIFNQTSPSENSFNEMFPSVFSPSDVSVPSNSGFNMMTMGAE